MVIITSFSIHLNILLSNHLRLERVGRENFGLLRSPFEMSFYVQSQQRVWKQIKVMAKKINRASCRCNHQNPFVSISFVLTLPQLTSSFFHDFSPPGSSSRDMTGCQLADCRYYWTWMKVWKWWHKHGRQSCDCLTVLEFHFGDFWHRDLYALKKFPLKGKISLGT